VVPSFFWNEWRKEVGIEEAQLIQSAVDRFRLNLIVGESFDREPSLARLHDVYSQKLGGVDIEFRLVGELEREKYGKIRMVKSFVSEEGSSSG